MSLIEELPAGIVTLLRVSTLTEFATISAAGVPIDTPVQYFSAKELKTIDLTTGLSYPVKAERARKNPKVGLLIEGRPDEPVISVAGIAAVRDADLQTNVDRYVAESCYTLPGNPAWPLARKAVWYWTRMIIEVTPARVLWWNNKAEMDTPPSRWDAPAETVYPKSDPAPAGAPSAAPEWKQPPWQELAQQALKRNANGHLSLVDAEGYPMPVRVRTISAAEDGFAIELPASAPRPASDKASLTFQGIETFVGEIAAQGGQVHLRVDRALPVFPITSDLKELWEPAPHTLEELMRRLHHEAKRRGQAIPSIPTEKPSPTEGYKLRLVRRNIPLPP
jgi:hypothetical protein